MVLRRLMAKCLLLQAACQLSGRDLYIPPVTLSCTSSRRLARTDVPIYGRPAGGPPKSNPIDEGLAKRGPCDVRARLQFG